jgi:hypothetical protein
MLREKEFIPCRRIRKNYGSSALYNACNSTAFVHVMVMPDVPANQFPFGYPYFYSDYEICVFFIA